MRNTIIPGFLIMTVVILNLTMTVNAENENKKINVKSNMANPASVYCINHSGKLLIKKDDKGNEYGICVFSDGSQCDEWKFFRGECKKPDKSLKK